jgi:glycosyltransferase involved in cell wall biosynthesis
VDVLHVVDSATYGGAEECVLQLLRARAGFVLATDPVPARFADGVEATDSPLVELAPVRGRRDGPGRVASPIAGLLPDVVHVNLLDPATCVDVLEGAVASGVPVVADVHLSGPVLDPGGRLARAYAGCAAVVARSARVAALLTTAFGVPEVRVVGNGVPVPAAAIPVRDAAGQVRIRAVGRLTEQKGFDVLIEATRLLLAAGHRVDVTVAGEGRDREELLRSAAGLPVRFRGFVTDVPEFLRGADVFCLPSRLEALPLALLEALVAGLPCVATDCGDIASTVDGLAAVVPPGDADALAEALAALVADQGLRVALAGRARAAADRFDVRHPVDAMHSVYRTATAVPA